MYAPELRSIFCEVAGISAKELATEDWAGRLGVIFGEIGQPLIALGKIGPGRGIRVPIREWVTRLRRRLVTDSIERAQIARLKQQMAERIWEVEAARRESQRDMRVAAAQSRKVERERGQSSWRPVAMEGGRRALRRAEEGP